MCRGVTILRLYPTPVRAGLAAKFFFLYGDSQQNPPLQFSTPYSLNYAKSNYRPSKNGT
ncbi:MAG: hypothetical protein N4J56_003976 [Chroococcidiopsis sp. SAG 2025]|nr:hypothetical protein [Chroococcidiopsis sp. SAG 2025]